MMMMHGSAPLYSRPAAPEGETISISIGHGSDRSSSIVLPRGHDLVKHLERLIPATSASSPQSQPQQQTLQPLMYAKTQPESAAARFDAVRALSSLPYQQSPTQAPISSMSQYIHANSRYETSAAVPATSSLPRSPLYHSDSSNNGGVRVYHHTPEYLELAGEPRATRTRRRRGANGASSGKCCQVVGCDKISVSRGLCRGHGGGRRCQHAGCTKGAQSRSDFCWAHGGGQRCEVKGCMRSRKSKRFCVAHLNWETTAPVAPAPVYETLPRQMELPMPIVPKAVSPVGSLSPTALNGSPRLPSLLQALRNMQQSSMTVQS
ncbi:hypothetical protein PHYSODRAFT_563285 [Phytophthora sojae]|uniref:WRKY19-like zinc finger domain-containing protein n=1 Tax=Phytophthora sojae (strain P6497) TaxID=1094619 RepID=G4ZXC7_PHYSP|nr:hypothetical protein PHYSODRAFT_563285 [Phytophthora sojae]EGZ12543.1 hypothetical protein PHYSODRAFT_563285 [Phytophthora sojae]|eukprot:XP_009532876.1 hypothetical protein PHYSODRAFT_563285 [Phytophthora sojae]